jgi:mannose-1-phosphate guanylyltransferase
MRWGVIIAGGSGSRFWPLSTRANPKQLLPLAGPRSTAESTLERLSGLVEPDRVLLVTGRQLARPIMERLGLPERNVLVEPVAKSTGPALVWATYEARRRDPAAVIIAQHADWQVPDTAAFSRVASRAFGVAESTRSLVTVGIVPTRVETGYGYIVPGDQLESGVHRVEQFVEKPDPTTAAALIARGALWNSGLFCWRAEDLLGEVRRITPELGSALDHLDREDVAGFFSTSREISIDVGVFERSDRVVVVRGDFAWDDVGTWDALARVRPRDASDNVTEGPVTAVGATGCVAWSDGMPIVLAGVSDLVVVQANGRILVTTKAKAPALKQVLEEIPLDVREI